MPSSIGSALSGIGNYVSSAFSPTVAAAPPSDVPAVPSAPIDLTGTSPSGGLGAPSLLPSAGDGSSGGGMAAPYPSLLSGTGAAGGAGGGGAPFGNITPPAVDASGNPIAPTPGGASPSWISQIISAVTGKDPSKGGTGAFIGDVGNIGEAIQRWQMQQTLQNPSAVAANAAKLYQPMSAALKRNIIAPVTAAAQETGQINAPALYSQSVATALAPYQYQMQENALREYLAAMQESEGAYPGTGGLYGPYGGYGSYPGEQQQQAQATPS